MGAGWCYLYRADGPSAPDEGHRFEPSQPLFDPYAKAFTGALPARRRATELPALPPRCVVVRDDFDLAGGRHPRHPPELYEIAHKKACKFLEQVVNKSRS